MCGDLGNAVDVCGRRRELLFDSCQTARCCDHGLAWGDQGTLFTMVAFILSGSPYCSPYFLVNEMSVKGSHWKILSDLRLVFGCGNGHDRCTYAVWSGNHRLAEAISDDEASPVHTSTLLLKGLKHRRVQDLSQRSKSELNIFRYVSFRERIKTRSTGQCLSYGLLHFKPRHRSRANPIGSEA